MPFSGGSRSALPETDKVASTGPGVAGRRRHLRAVTPRPRSPLRPALRTARPHQWIKNALVIAAPGAAGALGRDDVPVRVGLAFLAFCLLASGIYAINDVRDAEEDRAHPRKRHRPVAAGELEPSTAVAFGVGLMASGLALCVVVRPLVAVVGAGYLLLTLSYSLVWRHILMLDLVAIAGGFVLRAIAGGAAAPVALSRWFMLVITFAALFVAAGKRQSELAMTDASLAMTDAPSTARGRRVLHAYDRPLLRLILAGSAAAALVAYCVWAFQLPLAGGVPWRPLSILPFAFGLIRYGMLVDSGKGEAPEDLLLADRRLQLAGLLWLALFVLGVNAAS